MLCSMNINPTDFVPTLNEFEQAADLSRYIPLPNDWCIGVSDVVDSTNAIAAGRYKAVNLAGAGTISAVTNALGGELQLFVFGGDGAQFAVLPAQAQAAADALSRTAMWAKCDLVLELRVGMVNVSDVRAAGFDVLAAFWRASEDVRYAMFGGGGLEWVEAQLKSGAIGLASAAPTDEPDLTGLSCQWGPILPRNGNILSLIVKPAPGAPEKKFAAITSRVVSLLNMADCLTPVPEVGPEVRWQSHSVSLQSRVAHRGYPQWLRRLCVIVTAALTWMIFKFNIGVFGFNPNRYRREIAANTDFRKYNDGLLMTADCSAYTIEQLRSILDEAAAVDIVRYGIHVQEEALMTCVVPSVQTPDHMHFIDGAGGGYAAAAAMLRE